VVKQTLDGNVTVDFKDATSLRELCRALLLSDFRLSVDIPPDRLIPTIPQRLNYLLWLEDIFSVPSEPLTGIDIGEFFSALCTEVSTSVSFQNNQYMW